MKGHVHYQHGSALRDIAVGLLIGSAMFAVGWGLSPLVMALLMEVLRWFG